MRTVIKYGLQPTLLILVLAIWYFSDNPGMAFLATGFFIPTLLTLLERWVPGRPEWKQPLSYSGVLAVVFTVGASVYPAWHLFRLKPVDAMRHS